MLRGQFSSDEPTPVELLRSDAGSARCLLVIGDGFVSTHALPARGDLILGRAAEADIAIDVSCISRRHALLRIGESTQIEDLGSANGTFVDDRRLERGVIATLPPGAAFELGSVMLMLQDRQASIRPRRIWTHGYFEARLEDECARAEQAHATFALLRVRATAPADSAAAVHAVLLACLRPADVVASYGPDDYEVLIADATDDLARTLERRLRARLAETGAEVRTGLAAYPADGRVPEALMARACAGVDAVALDDEPQGLIIESAAMKNLHRLLGRVAASDISVLVLGETGVGKEIVAERLHALSARVAAPLLRLNCAALAPDLLESELFGHERGAFTGAVGARPGLLETATGGTLFLDEVGDLPLALQAKLLRVLETRRVRRVGGDDDVAVDLRIVAATHRDLEAEVAAGRFRQDLLFRINGMTLVIPPLRERVDEIGPLATAFIAAYCRRHGRAPLPIDPAALRAMRRYEWPGNLRELRNVVERAVLLCTTPTITLAHLPADKMASTFEMRKLRPASSPPIAPAPPPVDLRGGMRAQERALIEDALARAGANQTRAAKLLGISRRTLIARLDEHGLPRPRKDPR
ncbi:MAG: sigma 54-interacting transcriptional regulator [Deltaproteobacteria bacterium]|nr:sigma 54-interacting transcriptional regulator [Deltaproteobacteria bacterium]